MLRGLGVPLLCLLLATAVDALELTGEFVQGGLVLGEVAPGTELRLEKQLVSINERGLFSLGFDRDAPAEMTLHIKTADGNSAQRRLKIVPREYRIQRIEGIAKTIMEPAPEQLTRIRAEAQLVRQARGQIVVRDDFASAFQWPLIGPISGVFGSQRVYNGRPGRPHYGVDVAAPTGTPITVPAAGTVTLAHPDMFYSGGTLIVDHGHGLSSTLMHLSKVLVKEGQQVKPGDIVAEVGATGRATGPHLDWRMNWFESRIDRSCLCQQ